MEIYCTRPRQAGEQPHLNDVDDVLLNDQSNGATERRQKLECCICGMPLILDSRFAPIEELGVGGFGRTFLAIDYRSDRAKRALKQFRSDKFILQAQLDKAIEGFDREKEVLHNLNHDRIPRLFDSIKLWAKSDKRLTDPNQSTNASEIGFLYLVQKYIPGIDLQKELETRIATGKTFSEDETLEVLEQILRILKYIHEQPEQVIHRDIKPSNIICSNTNQSINKPTYYLIDFGAVKVKQGIEAVEYVSPKNTIIYTPGISPDEQSPGASPDSKVTPSSDLYALAATCVWLLTGVRPDKLGIPDNLALWNNRTQVNPRLADILNKMLQRDQASRYQSADEVLEALKQLKSSGNIKKGNFSQWYQDHRKLAWGVGTAFFGLIVLGAAIASVPEIKCQVMKHCRIINVGKTDPGSSTSSNPTPPSDEIIRGTVRIGGGIAVLQITDALIKEFELVPKYKEIKIVNKGGGAGNGIQRLGLPLEDDKAVEITAYSEDIGPNIRANYEPPVSIGEEHIAVFVGSSHPDAKNLHERGLSSSQVPDIFAGITRNWSEVGGMPNPLHVINRKEGSGTRNSFKAKAMQGKDFAQPSPSNPNYSDWPKHETTQVIRAIGKQAISYGTYADVCNQELATIVRIDNKLPRDSVYPYTQPLYYIYRKDSSPATKAFIEFVTSPKGQGIIRQVLSICIRERQK